MYKPNSANNLTQGRGERTANTCTWDDACLYLAAPPFAAIFERVSFSDSHED